MVSMTAACCGVGEQEVSLANQAVAPLTFGTGEMRRADLPQITGSLASVGSTWLVSPWLSVRNKTRSRVNASALSGGRGELARSHRRQRRKPMCCDAATNERSQNVRRRDGRSHI